MSGLPVLLFLDISGGELLVILLVVFLVFGPEKMPDMARKAGRLMNQMKKASNDLTREFKKETSVLQNEIKAVQNNVNSEVESVTREYRRTKAQVAAGMNNVEPDNVTKNNKDIPDNKPVPDLQTPSETGQTHDRTSKTE